MSESTTAVGRGDHSDRRQRQLFIGCAKFNDSPEKGVAYLREHGLLPDSAKGVAEFFRTDERVSKKALGHFFGGPDRFNQEVLAAFVQAHDFTEQSVLPALRQLLAGFLLPGEGQQIDRVASCFAEHYCSQNPATLQHADDGTVLCQALLLLNTLLHNPSVRQRPSSERFVAMVRQTGRLVLPSWQLVEMYDSVRAQPFEVPNDVRPDDLALSLRHPERSGWLCKLGGRLNCWQARWFVLKDNCLFYLAERDDAQPLGVVPLVDIRLRVVLDKRKKYCFELYSDNGVVKASERRQGLCDREVMPGGYSSYRLAASSMQEMTEWMQAITSCLEQQPQRRGASAVQDAVHRAARTEL